MESVVQPVASMRGRIVDFNRLFIRGMLVSRGKRLAHRPLCNGEQAEASASEHVIFITSLAETITACFSNPTPPHPIPTPLPRRGAVLEQLSGSREPADLTLLSLPRPFVIILLAFTLSAASCTSFAFSDVTYLPRVSMNGYSLLFRRLRNTASKSNLRIYDIIELEFTLPDAAVYLFLRLFQDTRSPQCLSEDRSRTVKCEAGRKGLSMDIGKYRRNS